MTQNDDLRQSILSGRSDANIRFDDLRLFLSRLGFVERVRGSHHIFRKEGVRELKTFSVTGVMPRPIK